MRILSLGAGVQSSTLALLGAYGEVESFSAAIFADTQNEPESITGPGQWLDQLESLIQAAPHPFPIHRVTAGNLAAAELRVRTSKKSGRRYLRSSIPAFVKNEDGSKGLLGRKCTRDFKITPIIQKTRELVGIKRARAGMPVLVRQAIGISWDEAHRMKPSRHPWIECYWPLIDLKMTREDCLSWMSKRGFPKPPRSACVFCPFHSDAEWRRLKAEEPAEFERSVRFEQRLHAAQTQQEVLKGVPYLHSSLQPLDMVDFAERPARQQIDMFGNECEGMCGV